MLNLFRDILLVFNHAVFWYFIVLNMFYLVLLLVSARAVRQHMTQQRIDSKLDLPKTLTKPFSVLIPAYNEAIGIVESVRGMLTVDYPEFEVIVINDGSADDTLAKLVSAFDLVKTDVEFAKRYPCSNVRGVYFSRREPKLAVIDKENGGKADAQNAGASLARYPYICVVDADSILSADSMKKLMREFWQNPATVSAGGIIRLTNGCVLNPDRSIDVRLPGKMIERIQAVEYLRAFLFGRIGWSKLNMLMIVSGAFGVFRQDILEQIGGYFTKAIGEDMELTMRFHAYIKKSNLPYKVSFVPDPVCWTQAPSTLKDLGIQRDRWHRGLMQSLLMNARLAMNPRYGSLGLFAFPYFLLFEFLGAPIEFLGIPIIIGSYAIGILDSQFFMALMIVSIVWGLCLSVGALVLAEMMYRPYPKSSDLVKLLWAAIAENFGYRQLHAYWRCRGIVRYFFGAGSSWGVIQRSDLLKDLSATGGRT